MSQVVIEIPISQELVRVLGNSVANQTSESCTAVCLSTSHEQAAVIVCVCGKAEMMI